MEKAYTYNLMAVFLVQGNRQYLIKTPGGYSTVEEWEYNRSFAQRRRHGKYKVK